MLRAYTEWKSALVTQLRKLSLRISFILSMCMRGRESTLKKFQGGTGLNTYHPSSYLPLNNPLYVVSDEIIVTKTARITAIEALKQEKVEYIREIFKLLLISHSAEDKPNEKANPYWYGDRFDYLYDKDLTYLKMTLAIYRSSKDRKSVV